MMSVYWQKEFDDYFNDKIQYFGKLLGLFDQYENENFLKKKLSELSMGMLRRYGLMRSILLLDIYGDGSRKSPKLLLLDEVSRGLGSKDINKLIRAINVLKRQFNVSLIAISHNLDFIACICDHFRMIFRGFLLPRILYKDDLFGRKTELRKCQNTYYVNFLTGKDEQRRPEDQKKGLMDYHGCIYNYYTKCPNRQSEKCKHAEFRKLKKVSICD